MSPQTDPKQMISSPCGGPTIPFGDYEQRYAAAADAAIEAGFVLADDRDALLAFADPSAIAD